MKQRQWIYTSKETGERFAVKELSGDTESGQQLLAVHTGRQKTANPWIWRRIYRYIRDGTYAYESGITGRGTHSLL